MPRLRDALSDNFEGSSFVWKGFKMNPALSILGLPLLFLEAALLPIRAITNRKDWIHNDDRDRHRLILKPGMPDFDIYTGHSGKNTWKHGEVQERERFDGLQSEHAEQDYSDDRHGGRRMHKHRKAKIRHESVLYPGWRLPHGGFRARLKNKPEFELRRTLSLPYDMAPGGYGRDYRSVYPHMYGPQSQFGDQYQNPRVDLRGQGVPTRPTLERLSRQGSHIQPPPAQPHIYPLPQMQEDSAQVGDQQPYGPGGFPNFTPAPANYVPPAASTVHSGSHSSHPASKAPSHVISTCASSRRSKTATAQSDTMSDEDGESYVTQCVRSLGSHNSVRSQQPWPRSSSSIRTHPQFKPTHSNESVSPSESVSQCCGPAPSQHPSENLQSEQAPSRNSKGRSHTSSRSATVEEVLEGASRTARRPGSGMFRQPISANPSPRSPSISTINTELPDAIPSSSRSHSPASRARVLPRFQRKANAS